MGIINSNKELSINKIKPGDEFQIKLSLSSTPDILCSPTDIILLLDRSGSMSGEAMTALKKGVCDFINFMETKTHPTKQGYLGHGNRMSIVSFASTATIDENLTSSVKNLKAAVNAMISGGSTNHKDAFQKCLEVFSSFTTNNQVVILFTDGESNIGAEGFEFTDALKANGVTIYSLGYGSSPSLKEEFLQRWASSPASAYTTVASNTKDIELLFTNMAQNVTNNGATNICITDTLSDCFKVLSVESPLVGSASIVDEHTIQWGMESLGTKISEGATCIIHAQHVGNCCGTVEVNQSLSYFDFENNAVHFQSPTIYVDCETSPVIVEDCPVSYDITVDSCTDAVEYIAGDIEMNSLGRILQLSATLKNVCPNKKVALAVILYEVDASGNEYSRGMKTLLIPAQAGNTCKDITVRCIKFVVPEELDQSGNKHSLCNERKFKAEFIANYAESDFYCCEV